MADVTQTLALLILAQNFKGDIVRQINRRSVLLSTLRAVPGEGKNVAWAAEKSGALAESFAEGADASNFGSDGQDQAILTWGQYRSNFHVSGLAQAASRTSRTPAGNIDLWRRNMMNGVMALADLMNQELYSGNAANKFVGLGQAIGLTNNTYATIDRTVSGNEYWQPYVADPGSATALTFDQIRTDLATIYTNSGSRPDVAFCSPFVLNKLGSLFDPQKFYMYSTDRVVTAKGQVQLEGGVGAIKFDGCVFIEDKDATESTIFYVNSEFVEIEYLPLAAPVLGMNDEVMDMGMSDGFEDIPLGLRMEMLAKTGDSDKAQMKTYVQLAVRRPNACGVRKNVDIA
ncbi:phage major capsid protein [Polyangium sp. 15x6]|uniref:phage major capsid protein n=1 Tax=Polyangium sp. 15x6 TaxID=3042687 RepID=UPI00249C2981|nr:phage major capsid protein [Polyangium sp. 15x6]MDI3282122.1 phage major capsid protein [Polyangium sp. 15x6]